MSDTIQAISRSLSADIAALNTISHNVANLNTPGFRAERSVPSFQSQVEGGAPGRFVDLRDGPVVVTGRPLDLALRGRGFFEVQRGGETLLVRAGQLRLDAENRLVTAQGDAVLVDAGAVDLADANVRIDAHGELWSGERSLGRLRLVEALETSKLAAVDGGYRYDGARGDFRGSVQQGALEQANVDAADESVRLMALTRHVESVQRAISIYDKAMDTGINRIGEN